MKRNIQQWGCLKKEIQTNGNSEKEKSGKGNSENDKSDKKDNSETDQNGQPGPVNQVWSTRSSQPSLVQMRTWGWD